MRPARILVDTSDTYDDRGFHVLAGLTLIANRLRSAKLYRFGTDSSDERIAALAFCFDTKLKLRRSFGPPWRKFDLFVTAANAFPLGKRSIAAQRMSRRSIVALLFYGNAPPPDNTCVAVDGHDTVAIGRTVLRELAALRAVGDE
jgi:hypothetical protein